MNTLSTSDAIKIMAHKGTPTALLIWAKSHNLASWWAEKIGGFLSQATEFSLELGIAKISWLLHILIIRSFKISRLPSVDFLLERIQSLKNKVKTPRKRKNCLKHKKFPFCLHVEYSRQKQTLSYEFTLSTRLKE